METQKPGWGKSPKPGNGGKRPGAGRKKKIYKLTDAEKAVIEQMRKEKPDG